MTESVFLDLWSAVRPYLAAIARKLARRGRVDVDDLLSSAAVELWRVRDRLGTCDHPGALARHAGRLAMIAARQPELRYAGRVLHLRTDSGESPVEWAEGREGEPRPDEFAALLALADDRDRSLLVRRYGDGLTAEAMAAELGVSATRVKQKLTRAAARLRARLR